MVCSIKPTNMGLNCQNTLPTYWPVNQRLANGVYKAPFSVAKGYKTWFQLHAVGLCLCLASVLIISIDFWSYTEECRFVLYETDLYTLNRSQKYNRVQLFSFICSADGIEHSWHTTQDFYWIILYVCIFWLWYTFKLIFFNKHLMCYKQKCCTPEKGVIIHTLTSWPITSP